MTQFEYGKVNNLLPICICLLHHCTLHIGYINQYMTIYMSLVMIWLHVVFYLQQYACIRMQLNLNSISLFYHAAFLLLRKNNYNQFILQTKYIYLKRKTKYIIFFKYHEIFHFSQNHLFQYYSTG